MTNIRYVHGRDDGDVDDLPGRQALLLPGGDVAGRSADVTRRGFILRLESTWHNFVIFFT